MITIEDLTRPYEQFMLRPRIGPRVCPTCFNFTPVGFRRCYACTHGESWLAVMAPVSYSIAGEQLHRTLRSYKRSGHPRARRFCLDVAAVLWRYLAAHEHCVAQAAGVAEFELVTVVPSGNPLRDAHHRLRWIVGKLVAPTRRRYQRLLSRTDTPIPPRRFSRNKYEPLRRLTGESVLLIDDTWTTGSSAQSAAAALKQAGAGPIGTVVIGRYLNRSWRENDLRLRTLGGFDWEHCALCQLDAPLPSCQMGRERSTR